MAYSKLKDPPTKDPPSKPHVIFYDPGEQILELRGLTKEIKKSSTAFTISRLEDRVKFYRKDGGKMHSVLWLPALGSDVTLARIFKNKYPVLYVEGGEGLEKGPGEMSDEEKERREGKAREGK